MSEQKYFLTEATRQKLEKAFLDIQRLQEGQKLVWLRLKNLENRDAEFLLKKSRFLTSELLQENLSLKKRLEARAIE